MYTDARVASQCSQAAGSAAAMGLDQRGVPKPAQEYAKRALGRCSVSSGSCSRRVGDCRTSEAGSETSPLCHRYTLQFAANTAVRGTICKETTICRLQGKQTALCSEHCTVLCCGKGVKSSKLV